MPTLVEYLDVCKEYGLHPVIELKYMVQTESLPDLAAILDAREEKDRFVIISFSRPLVAGIKALLPEIPAYLLGEPATADDVAFCVENGIDGLDTLYNVSESVIRLARDAGLQLMAWTVDSVELAERMANFGILDLTSNCLVPGRAPAPEEETTAKPETEPVTEPETEPSTEPATEPATEPSGSSGSSLSDLFRRIADWFRRVFAVIAGWFGR